MPDSANPPVTTNQNTVKLIFVVEDDVDHGLLIIQIIRQETSHHVMHHTTGHQALSAINIHTPHLFILDYGLPDMTGIELHDLIHAIDLHKNTPTILMSAQKPPVREMRKRQITYLAKPFNITDLLHAIEKHLT